MSMGCNWQQNNRNNKERRSRRCQGETQPPMPRRDVAVGDKERQCCETPRISVAADRLPMPRMGMTADAMHSQPMATLSADVNTGIKTEYAKTYLCC